MITTSGFFSLSCSTWLCTSVALDGVGDIERDGLALVLEHAGDHARRPRCRIRCCREPARRCRSWRRGLHVGQEVVIDLGEVGGDRRGAEEPFEAALGEVGGDQLAVDERNSVFFGDRARRQRDAGLIGAGQRHHLLLGDQPQRLVLPGGRAALVVGEHHLDLGAAEAGEAGVLRQREIAELGMGVVDDVDRDFDRGLGMDAGAGGVAAQRKDRADLDGLVLRRGMARQRNGNRGGAKQPEDMLKSHVDGLRKVATRCQASDGLGCARHKPRNFPYFWPVSIACPIGRGKLRARRKRARRKTINRLKAPPRPLPSG